VLKPAGGDDYALAVDIVHDHEELVVKPAAPLVMAAGLYAGTTLADDGCPILLLDPSGIAAAAGVVLDQNDLAKHRHREPFEVEKRDEVPALLFRTFEGAKRAVRLSIVERIEDVPCENVKYSAGRLRVTLGNTILPLAGCGDIVPTGTFRILRLSDGAVELAYGFAEVIDLVTLGDDVAPASAPGEIGGVTLIDGEQVEVIDSHWLFGEQEGPDPVATGMVCALPAEDPWMQNILRPLIQAAGYQILPAAGADAARADLIIASSDAQMPIPQVAPVLRIRSRPERSGDDDDSIYRYDRAGLLTALTVHARKRKG
jgi:two-component system chemotaxis sensor kinase CheA